MNIKEKIVLINSNDDFYIAEDKIDSMGQYVFRTGFAKSNSEGTYYSMHYSSVMPSMARGVVRCENEEDAHIFLDLVIDRINSKVPFNYSSVIEAEQKVRQQVAIEVISCLTDGEARELPYEGEKPYWVFTEAEKVICVTGWGHGEEDLIPNTDGAIWLDNEPIFDYEYGYELAEYPLPFAKDSLEFYLLRQCFVSDKSGYIYTCFDAVTSVWALPHADNIKAVAKSFAKDNDFQWWVDNNPERLDRWIEIVSSQNLTPEQRQKLETISN